MNARRETMLWVAQRLTAAILGVCVLVHLVTIIYAVRGGLSAAEILGRTRHNFLLAGFYTTFVAAAAIHAAIGLRTIAAEWLSFKGSAADIVMIFIGAGLVVLGLRAIVAVVA